MSGGRPVERYGSPRRLPRPVARALLVAGTLAGVAWVVWAGLAAADRDVRWKDVGYVVVDETRTDVTFDVVLADGVSATCLVRALDETRGEIGLAEVSVGPSDRPVVRRTVEVPTRQRAISGGVRTCTPD